MSEQASPSHQPQEDGYSNRGVDLVLMIAGEFGTSQTVVREQLSSRRVEILIDDDPWVPKNKRDRYYIPYDKAKGKVITVVGETIHWRMKFSG